MKKLTQYAIFDWLEFTLFCDFSTYLIGYDFDKQKSFVNLSDLEKKVYELFEELFHISSDKINYECRGRNGYSELYYYKNINCWVSTRFEMGIHFELSGQGCRDLEDLNINIYDLLKYLKNENFRVKYSRIDLSIDDFTNKYFTLDKINYYLNNKLIISKLRRYYCTNSGLCDSSDLLGQTIQFGSKAGLIHITFYNKLLERKNNNYLVSDEIKYWTRTEVRFRNEKANDVVEHVIKNNEINSIIKGVLKYYIRFLVPNYLDSNKCRYKTVSWWNNFLCNVDKLQLANPKVYSTIQTKKEWLKNQVSLTEFMCFISEVEDLTELTKMESNLILKNLQIGSNKVTQKQLTDINFERINNNLEPFSMEDIENISRLIKDVILSKKNKIAN